MFVAEYNVGGDCPADVDVPAQIGGKTVTGVGAFKDGDAPFAGVTSLTLPDTLQWIGVMGKLNVSKLTIPKSVKDFVGCTISGNEPDYTCTKGFTDVVEDNYNDGRVWGVAFWSSQPFNLMFESGGALEYIPNRAFINANIRSVQLPDSLKVVLYEAFSYNNLTSLTLPASIRLIDNEAFAGNRLSQLNLNEGLLYIDYHAFTSNKLTDVRLPASLESIGGDVFYDLTSNSFGGLENIELDGSAFTFQSENQYAYLTYTNIPMRRDDICGFASDDGTYSISGKTGLQMCQEFVSTEYWYTRLYTADGTNPRGFGDQSSEFGGIRLGGHLINPVEHVIRYVDESGAEVAPSVTQTGEGLTSYFANENSSSDTSLYYRLATYSAPSDLSAPEIDGYITPTSFANTDELGAIVSTFIYKKIDSASDDTSNSSEGDADSDGVASGELAATGWSTVLVGGSGLSLVGLALALIRRRS